MDVKQEWGDNIAIGYNYNVLEELKIIWWSHERGTKLEIIDNDTQFWLGYHEFYGFHIIQFLCDFIKKKKRSYFFFTFLLFIYLFWGLYFVTPQGLYWTKHLKLPLAFKSIENTKGSH